MQRRKLAVDLEQDSLEELAALVGSDADDKSHSPATKWGREDFFFLILRRVVCCGSGCAVCCILLLFAIVWIIHEGHHVTCLFHSALCTPFREYVARFPMLPKLRKDRQPLQSRIPHSCGQFEEFLSRHDHKSRRLLFLIGESRGGSTYTYDTLGQHPDIEMIGGEALFGFSNNICNNNELLLRNHENCTFHNWLNALYDNAYGKRPRVRHLLGTKINIEQIPPEFYEDFACYLACIRDSAFILHVTRASAIASFLNYQSEVPERLYQGNWEFHSNNLAKGLETPLELDPELAAEWVHTRDELSQELFRTLGFAAPLPLMYQRVYYEHLQDPVVGDRYWKSVFAFLGVRSNLSVKRLRESSPINKSGQLRTHNKTHGETPCSERIANWVDVKAALGPDSLSSIACEVHSR